MQGAVHVSKAHADDREKRDGTRGAATSGAGRLNAVQ